MSWIGLDIGSTRLKRDRIDDDGHIVALGRTPDHIADLKAELDRAVLSNLICNPKNWSSLRRKDSESPIGRVDRRENRNRGFSSTTTSHD